MDGVPPQEPLDHWGGREALTFLYEDDWLQQALVTTAVTKHRGLWHVSLVFVHARPFRLRLRPITTAPTRQKAEQKAAFYYRTVTKSLKQVHDLLYENFSICLN